MQRGAARSAVTEAACASAVLPAAATAPVELQHGTGPSCRPALLQGAVHEVQQSRFDAGFDTRGHAPANGAWLACCVLAHNLARWTARLGRTHPARQLTVAATIRNRLLTVPGRFVNHSGRHRLRLPLNWPWQNTFTTALQRIRNLPLLI